SLEMLLTILRTKENISPRIIGLSASLNDESADNLCNWLNAVKISHPFREIDLREGILYCGNSDIPFQDFKLKKGDFLYTEANTGRIDIEHGLNFQNPDVIKDYSDRESFLLFYNTRPKTERNIGEFDLQMPDNSDLNQLISDTEAVVEEDNITFVKLKRTLKRGAGFHHSGLLQEERLLAQKAFNKRLIRILSSTTGLGAGINTPAKNVLIFDTKYYSGKAISVLEYKNMAGRAGRLGYDVDYGRSVLFAFNNIEFERYWRQYIQARPENVVSQLGKEKNLIIYILNSLITGLCQNEEDLLNSILKTYFGFMNIDEERVHSFEEFKDKLSSALNSFKDEGILVEENDRLEVTEKGIIIATEGISINTGKTILEALHVLSKEVSKKELAEKFEDFLVPFIHLACSTEDALNSWSVVYPPKYFEKQELRDFWKDSANNFLTMPKTDDHYYQAIKTTKLLLNWIAGFSYSKLGIDYGLYYGQIRNIASNISRIVGIINRYSKLDEFNFEDEHHIKIDDLKDRLNYGVPTEALELIKLRIPEISRKNAITISNSGIATLEQLSTSDVQNLASVQGISRDFALRILSKTENYIENTRLRIRKSQVRRVSELGKDPTFVELIHTQTGIDFEKACYDVFLRIFEFSCEYCGEELTRTCDFYFKTEEGIFAFECKRKIGTRKEKYVSTDESQEIIGKSRDLDPICMVTVGYPDFSQTAKKSCQKMGITLLTADVLGEMVVEFWKNKIDRKKIEQLLKQEKYLVKEDIDELVNENQ
ncbi:MAG: helicase-related protein, partial [Candidatus Odinarchaeota archaeon]